MKRLLLAAGADVANELASDWLRDHPDDQRPILALDAVSVWLREPTASHADLAASRSAGALASFAASKGRGARASWPVNAWFARSCAWLADGPRYGWQAAAALYGLQRTGRRDDLRDRLSALLELASTGVSGSDDRREI